MRKSLAVLAIAMGCLASAQNYGLKTGLQMTRIGGEAWKDHKGQTSFYVGGFMSIPLSDKFDIQPELLYKRNRGTIEFQNSGQLNTIRQTSKIDYISVPVMIQYKVSPKFYVEAGPEFSVLLNSSTQLDLKSPIPTNPNFDLGTYDNYIASVDYGVGAGLGYWITPSLGISARYTQGVVDVTKQEDTKLDFGKYEMINGTFQAGVNYKF